MDRSPEGVRQKRLRDIVASLGKAKKGDWVQLSTLIGRISYQTGARVDTVTGYFRTLAMAEIAEVQWREDQVRLTGSISPRERESKREKRVKK